MVRSPGQLLAQDNDWANVCQAYGRATRKPKGVHAQAQPDPSEVHEAWQTCSQDYLANLINTLPQSLLCTFVLTGSFVRGDQGLRRVTMQSWHPHLGHMWLCHYGFVQIAGLVVFPQISRDT